MALLITETTDIKKYLAVNVNIDFQTIKPYIENAQIEFLLPWIGQEIIDDLETNLSTTTGVYPQAVEMVQRSLTYFSVLKALPFIEVNIGDEGITRTESEHAKSAYRGQIARIQEQLKIDANNHLEIFLDFLEDNKADYPLWTDAPGYIEFSNYFFKDAKDFAYYYPIINGRLTYNKLLSSMRYVTEFFIKAEIGKPQFDDLFSKRFDPSVNEYDAEALIHIKNAVAHLTVAQSCALNWTTLTDKGIHFSERVPELDKQTNATSDQLNLKIKKIEDRGRAYIALLVEYLNKYITEFPAFESDESITKSNEDLDSSVGQIKGAFAS